jgi:spore maturation protein CgeB
MSMNFTTEQRLWLNIHHEQSQNGANPKVFEICGSGSYQICDANPYIESFFQIMKLVCIRQI